MITDEAPGKQTGVSAWKCDALEGWSLTAGATEQTVG